MEIRFAGIDYSYSCPAIAIYIGEADKFSFDACRFFYLIGTKKYCESFHNNIIQGEMLKEYNCEEQRYHDIAVWAIDILEKHKIQKVCLEGYSMGSKGKVFNIAENCGTLKQMMWKHGYGFDVIPPTTVKKFARGKGSGNKDDMHKAFLSSTGVDLQAEMCPDKSKVVSPVGDIVDAFYLLKYGVDMAINAGYSHLTQ